MKTEVVNFSNLGYKVNLTFPVPHQGAINQSLQLRSQYLLEGKLISPQKARQLYNSVNKILYPLCQRAGIPTNRVHLNIVRDSFPNVMIWPPTGEIFLTTGLLNKKNLTDGNLAAVLGHELGHLLKYSSTLLVPFRFKNPLYQQYILGSQQALGQQEEYLADELGLILADAGGYSVDEVLNIAQWLAKFVSKKKGISLSQRILRPGETHPHMGTRSEVIRDLINDQRFIWKSGHKKSRVFLTPLLKSQLESRFGSESFPSKIYSTIRKVDPSKLSPFDLSTINWLAQNACLDIKHSLFDCYEFLKRYTQENFDFLDDLKKDQIKTFFSQLKAHIEHGDLLSHAYYQALISHLYFTAVKNNTASECLKRLQEECGISPEEIMLALLRFVQELTKIYEEAEEVEQTSLKLKDIILPLPFSLLRDEIITALLLNPFHLSDREAYIDQEFFFNRIEKLKLSHLSTEGAMEILPLLHGTTAVTFDYYEHVKKVDEKDPDRDEIIEDLKNSLHLFEFYDYSKVILTLVGGAPFDRENIESLLSLDVKFLRETKEILLFEYFSKLKMIYMNILDCAKTMKTQEAKKRVEQLGRLIVLRILDALPIPKWEEEAFNLVEALPKSTEKNHLLILLAKKGKRNVSLDELVFEQIPDPDENLGEGSFTFLNSLGFTNQEAIYPSGQRILDRWIGEQFFKSGPLNFKEIVRLIPRSSPGRDEFLDRTLPHTLEEAKQILNVYWSPTFAFTKAYNIASDWLKNSSGEKEIFENIISLTAEFPSLQRRMVRLWTNKFGIQAQDYDRVCEILSSVDIIDLYKGGMIEAGSKLQIEAKISICLATIAASLERKDFSLLTLKELDRKEKLSIRISDQEDLEKIEEEDEEIGKEEPEKIGKDEEDLEEEEIEEVEKEEKEKKRDRLLHSFRENIPFLPENAWRVAKNIWENSVYAISAIPFVDNEPRPDSRFQRFFINKNAVAELKKWDLGKQFFSFMRAMGGEEVVSFYESMFLGKGGLLEYEREFKKLEEIFLKAIAALLQEKKVPLKRCSIVQENMKLLMKNLPWQTRGKIWARILAGIAQKQDIGEITREAVRPLQATGAKLMQAVHSLTAGVDSTLEEATRKALDQTAGFSLTETLQALGGRLDASPFARHSEYRFLGSGSVRTGIGGIGGEHPDEVFLLPHARPYDKSVVSGVANFISDVGHKGQIFPLTPSQFSQLVKQAEKERTEGLTNHNLYGESYNWQLGREGMVKIPRIILNYRSWGSLELVQGTTYQNLSPEEKKKNALLILEAIQSQKDLFNPEFHGGNLIITPQGIPFLIDCGLIGRVTQNDEMALFSIFASFRQFGLNGAAAAALFMGKKESISSLEEVNKSRLMEQIRTIEDQIRAGTPPELLLPALSHVTERAGGLPITLGLDLLFRATQHAAPLVRDAGDPAKEILSSFPISEDIVKLAREIELELRKSISPKKRETLPKGTAVGRKLKSGKIQALGVIREEGTIMDASQGILAGTIKCVLENITHYLHPEDLFVQTSKGKWLVFDEWKKVNLW